MSSGYAGVIGADLSVKRQAVRAHTTAQVVLLWFAFCAEHAARAFSLRMHVCVSHVIGLLLLVGSRLSVGLTSCMGGVHLTRIGGIMLQCNVGTLIYHKVEGGGYDTGESLKCTQWPVDDE